MRLNELTGKIKEILQSDKKIKLIVAAGFLGMLLIFLSNGKSSAADASFQPQAVPLLSIEELTVRTEEKLRAVISSIDGVGSCKVLVTFESGIECVYANESKNTSDTSDEGEGEKKQEKLSSEISPVIIEQGRGKEALKVKELQPRVRGVVVVCDGAQDILVRQQIIDTVTTSMDISSAKVCVAKAAAKH